MTISYDTVGTTPGVYLPAHDATLIFEISTATALNPTQAWLDASPYILNRAGSMHGRIVIDRGRDSETTEFRPATLSLSLDNTYRTFDTRNTDSPFYGALRARRQVRLRAHRGPPGGPAAPPTTLFRGFIRGWPRSYGMANQFSWVDVNAIDGFRIFQQTNLSEGSFILDDDEFGHLDGIGRLGGDDEGVELSGDRLRAFIDIVGWPPDLTAIDDGLVVVGEQDTEDGLSAMRQVELAENGYLFIDSDGTLTFYDRLAPWEKPRTATTQVKFGGDGLQFTEVTGVGPDDSLIKNDIRRVGLSGIEQSDSDEFSVQEYGRSIDGPEDLIAVHDGDVAAIVALRLADQSNPVERIDSLRLAPAVDPDTLYDEVLERRVLDRIELDLWPPGGDPYPTFVQLVQGIRHEISDDGWFTDYRLAPAPVFGLFTLDDDVLGLLDSEAVLAP